MLKILKLFLFVILVTLSVTCFNIKYSFSATSDSVNNILYSQNNPGTYTWTPSVDADVLVTVTSGANLFGNQSTVTQNMRVKAGTTYNIIVGAKEQMGPMYIDEVPENDGLYWTQKFYYYKNDFVPVGNSTFGTVSTNAVSAKAQNPSYFSDYPTYPGALFPIGAQSYSGPVLSAPNNTSGYPYRLEYTDGTYATYYCNSECVNYYGGVAGNNPGNNGSITVQKTTVISTFIDIGLRIKQSDGVKIIAIEPSTSASSPLKIAKNGMIYSIALVDPNTADASKIIIKTATGPKALRIYR